MSTHLHLDSSRHLHPSRRAGSRGGAEAQRCARPGQRASVLTTMCGDRAGAARATPRRPLRLCANHLLHASTATDRSIDVQPPLPSLSPCPSNDRRRVSTLLHLEQSTSLARIDRHQAPALFRHPGRNPGSRYHRNGRRSAVPDHVRDDEVGRLSLIGSGRSLAMTLKFGRPQPLPAPRPRASAGAGAMMLREVDTWTGRQWCLSTSRQGSCRLGPAASGANHVDGSTCRPVLHFPRDEAIPRACRRRRRPRCAWHSPAFSACRHIDMPTCRHRQIDKTCAAALRRPSRPGYLTMTAGLGRSPLDMSTARHADMSPSLPGPRCLTTRP